MFNKVNKFDQYQCLQVGVESNSRMKHGKLSQKMICEAMGTAEDLVVAGVNSQFGQQVSKVPKSQECSLKCYF